RLQAADAAQRSRTADRPAGVGAETTQDQPGGKRRGSARAGAARDAAQVPRAAGEAQASRGIREPDGEFVQDELAEADSARLAQPADGRGVLAPAPGGTQDKAVGGRRRVFGGQDVFDAERDAVERTAVGALLQLVVRLFGSAQGAVFGKSHARA